MNTQSEAEKEQEQPDELTAEEQAEREVVIRRLHELFDGSQSLDEDFQHRRI